MRQSDTYTLNPITPSRSSKKYTAVIGHKIFWTGMILKNFSVRSGCLGWGGQRRAEEGLHLSERRVQAGQGRGAGL